MAKKYKQITMILQNLVPFYIAKQLYEMGYDKPSEYSYPCTQKGERYKTGESRPFIYLDNTQVNNTVVTTWKCNTDFKENRLSAPTFYEVNDWLLEVYNILIETHSYNSRGDYKTCKWIVDIDKKPLMIGTKKRMLYETRFKALSDAIELTLNKIYAEFKS